MPQHRPPVTAAQLRTLAALSKAPARRAMTWRESRWMLAGVPYSGPVDRLILRGLVSVEGDLAVINKRGRDVLAVVLQDA